MQTSVIAGGQCPDYDYRLVARLRQLHGGHRGIEMRIGFVDHYDRLYRLVTVRGIEGLKRILSVTSQLGLEYQLWTSDSPYKGCYGVFRMSSSND